MAWITPLVVCTSVTMMLLTRPFGSVIVALSASIVSSASKDCTAPLVRSAARTLAPATTCEFNVLVRVCCGTSAKLSKPNSVSRSLNAAFVGAKTVKVPDPFRLACSKYPRNPVDHLWLMLLVSC